MNESAPVKPTDGQEPEPSTPAENAGAPPPQRDAKPESEGPKADGGESRASLTDRIVVVAWLLLFTVPVLWGGNKSIRKLEKLSTEEHTQAWSAPPGVSLGVGPETFAYDSETKLLTHRGPVTRAQQEELRRLIQFPEPRDDADSAQRATDKATYELAIDRLSFGSRIGATDILMWLLVVGGVFGAAGSLARVYTNFLIVACYQGGKRFNLGQWWPYYVLTPVLGFILGVFVTVLLKANLLTIESQSPAGNLWWAGVSIIVGFGAQDVAERLKFLGKALFGSSK